MRLPQHHKGTLIVGIVVAIIVGGRLISGLGERTGRVDPHVSLAENPAARIEAKQRQQQAQALMAVADGEVSRTEERIREATALATAASLFAANESLAGRTPGTVSALLSGINASGLMPPGMQPLDNGEVDSFHGKLFVRYRPDPLGVEIISLGKQREDGPVLLVRVPDDGSEDGAQLFLATRLDEITVPDPFTNEAEVIAMGYQPEPLRAAKLRNPDAKK